MEEQTLSHVYPVEPNTHLAPDENMYRKSVALDTFQPPMLWLNVAPAEANIEYRLATHATFQLAMFWLKADALLNICERATRYAARHTAHGRNAGKGQGGSTVCRECAVGRDRRGSPVAAA